MRLERIIAIIMLLLRKETVTAKEMSELFEVSIRTIYRDIDSINAAGIPIVSVAGVGGGISIMEQYKIEKGLFTTNDITAMLRGLGVISGAIGSEENSNALVKLKSFITDEQIGEVNKKLTQITFDLSSWMGADDLKTTLHPIEKALENRRMISFLYYGHHGQERFDFVEPHRLAYKGNNWYLQAYVPCKESFRLFKLRRITQIQQKEESYAPRKLHHPFSSFTSTMSSKTIPIKLKIHQSVLDKMLDYCTMSNVYPFDKDYFLVHFDFIEDDYAYGILLSFGKHLTVLEPEFVKVEMQKRLEHMLAAYQD